MINFCLISLISLTILGMYVDSRITNKRFILILLFFIFFIVISLYLSKLPYELIKDLFWYSVIMFGSFVIHVLWLTWLHILCENKGYDYACYIISRISFVLSISGLLYLITRLRTLMYEGRTRYKWKRDNNKFTNSIELEEHIKQKTEEIYEKYYTKKAVNLLLFYGYLTVEYKIFSIINSILTFLLMIIQLCLGYFVNNFNNYSMLLLGLNEAVDRSFIDYMKIILKLFLYFVITLLGAYLLGIPSRLYFIWMIMFIWTTLQCLYHFSRHKNTKAPFLIIWYIYILIFKGEWFSVEFYLSSKQLKQFRGFDLIYGEFMHYNLEYFIFSNYTSLNLWSCWEDFELTDVGLLWDGDHLGNMTRKPYPMISYLKYYTNEELAIGEYEAATSFNSEYLWMDPEQWPYEFWMRLIKICIIFDIPLVDCQKIYKNFPENLNTDKMLILLKNENVKNFKWIAKDYKFIYVE